MCNPFIQKNLIKCIANKISLSPSVRPVVHPPLVSLFAQTGQSLLHLKSGPLKTFSFLGSRYPRLSRS